MKHLTAEELLRNMARRFQIYEALLKGYELEGWAHHMQRDATLALMRASRAAEDAALAELDIDQAEDAA